MPPSLASSHALIGGIAYGGYARKVSIYFLLVSLPFFKLLHLKCDS
jgi:hypothetical protein